MQIPALRDFLTCRARKMQEKQKKLILSSYFRVSDVGNSDVPMSAPHAEACPFSSSVTNYLLGGKVFSRGRQPRWSTGYVSTTHCAFTRWLTSFCGSESEEHRPDSRATLFRLNVCGRRLWPRSPSSTFAKFLVKVGMCWSQIRSFENMSMFRMFRLGDPQSPEGISDETASSEM